MAARWCRPAFDRFWQRQGSAKAHRRTLDPARRHLVGSYKMGQDGNGNQVEILPGTQEMMKVVAPGAVLGGEDPRRVRRRIGARRACDCKTPSGDRIRRRSRDRSRFQRRSVSQLRSQGGRYRAAGRDRRLERQTRSVIEVDVSAAGRGAVAERSTTCWSTSTSSRRPFLAIETVPAGKIGTATILYPDQSSDYGVAIDQKGTPGNFRLEVSGHTFCDWQDGRPLVRQSTRSPRWRWLVGVCRRQWRRPRRSGGHHAGPQSLFQ